MLHLVSSYERAEPSLRGGQLSQDVVVNVELKSEYFFFLHLGLRRVCAASLAVLVARCEGRYLMGDEGSSEGRFAWEACLSSGLRRLALGLYAIN